jgi:hypothetical protein
MPADVNLELLRLLADLFRSVAEICANGVQLTLTIGRVPDNPAATAPETESACPAPEPEPEPAPARPLREIENNILEALGGGPLPIAALAGAAGYRLNSYFRSAVAALQRKGLVVQAVDGYRRVEAAEEDTD